MAFSYFPPPIWTEQMPWSRLSSSLTPLSLAINAAAGCSTCVLAIYSGTPMAIGRSRTRSLWWLCVIRFKRPTRGRFDSKILFQRRKNRFLPATRESLGVAAAAVCSTSLGLKTGVKSMGGLDGVPLARWHYSTSALR